LILPFLLLCQAVVASQKHRKALGETIRSYRKNAGLSQEALAEKADLHHNYVGELERGEKAATIDTLLKIAKALRVRVRDLVTNV
jgi:transcriptional regulator with XRE-family HTH domain